MAAYIYEIRDWERCYTVSQNRKNDPGKPLPWVAMRTKHDGKGFRRVMRLPDAMALMGAWMLIVEVAAKCPTHGRLVDADGPLSALDLADKTGGDEAIFERALQVFSTKDIAWLTTTAVEGSGRAFGLRDGTGQDGMERDETERNGTKSINPTPTTGLDRPAPLDRGKSGKSGFSKDSVVTDETLASVDALDRWIAHDLTRSDTICESSDDFKHNAHAAAVKARTAKGIHNRVNFFKWLVRERNWPFLRISDEEIAAACRRERDRENQTFEIASLIGGFLERSKVTA
jgi:hypothetical protein